MPPTSSRVWTSATRSAQITLHAIVKRLQPSVAQQRLKSLVPGLPNDWRSHHPEATQKHRRRYRNLASLDEVILLLKRQSRRLEDLKGEIASLIDDDPLWACLDQVFRSVKGPAYS